MTWIKTTDQLPHIDQSNEWRFDREISIEVLIYNKLHEEYRVARYYHLKQMWIPNGTIPTHWALIEPPEK